MRSTLGEFIGLMFKPFFKWWWAVLTGAASLLAFLWTPTGGLTVSQTGMLLVILGTLTLVFLVFSVLYQGWNLFKDRHRNLEVVSVTKTKDFGTDWIFLLRGYLRESTGILLEIRRPLEDVEVPFALVRVIGSTTKGLYQAVPVWISPGHLRDFSNRQFSASSLIAYPNIYFDRAREVFNELT